jgi:3-oxoadipate enol-lactonase
VLKQFVMSTTTLVPSKKINANGISMAYEDSGISGAETVPVIFIHGFPLDKTCWEKQLNFFKRTNRVIAHDIRGFGESGNNSEKPSIELFAEDLIEFMNELEIQKAIICGISMGGYIALNAITRHQERFEALILCNTQCGADSIEARDKRHFSIQQIEAGGIQDFASAFLKKAFTEHGWQHHKELIEKLKAKIISTSPKILTSTLAALLQRKDMCMALENIKVPTLIVSAKEDTVIPLSASEILHKGIQGSTLVSIEKAGHFCNFEQPEEFNKVVGKFIAGISK